MRVWNEAVLVSILEAQIYFFFLVTAQKHDSSVNVWLWDAQAVKAWDPNDGDDLNVKPSEEFALNFTDKCENESFSLDWSMRGTWL